MARRSDRPSRSTRVGLVVARFWPVRSVRVRIMLAAVLVTAAAMAGTGWLLVWSVEDSQLTNIREDSENLADQVAERLAAGVPPGKTVRAEQLTSGFVEIRYEDGTAIHLVPVGGDDEDRVAVVDLGAPTAEPASTDEIVAEESPSASDAPPRDDVPIVARPVVTRTVETAAGEVTVTVAAQVDDVPRSLDAIRRALTIGLPVLVVLVALAVWWLVGRALRPVDRIRAEADAISASTMHRRVSEPGSGDEVDRLSGTMNAMLARLDGAVTRQRQFVADASHELRNPVAGIRTDLEVALCEGDRADWPTVARAVLAEEARVETLIDDLLVLAAEDEGAPALPGTEVDLNGLATSEGRRSCTVPLSTAARADPLVVVGSHNQLQRALANLVDNAERHAKSQIRIETSRRAGCAELSVDDDGPGIPPADRDRVFERFTRLDDSRARDHGGSGLGLAVVRSIVTRHRGRVWTEDSRLGGARFVIALPVADPTPRPQRLQNVTRLQEDRPTTAAPWRTVQEGRDR
jgi:signal transduction histidine kinase